jgi:hypothetical protein
MSKPCRYCQSAVVLLKHGAPGYPYARDWGPVWACLPCDAWVGCHPGTEKALGGVANAELRVAKQAAHAAFDPLWRKKILRTIEPERQIIAILEDIDALTEKHGESEYLALLDGESQVNNIVFVATTNYPERLDRRFVDRPSRFDTLRYIGMPADSARRAYLHAKIGDDPVLDEMVEQSDGFSIAHLRELVILTQCFGHPVGSALQRLRKTINGKPSSDRAPDAPGFGFGTGKNRSP